VSSVASAAIQKSQLLPTSQSNPRPQPFEAAEQQVLGPLKVHRNEKFFGSDFETHSYSCVPLKQCTCFNIVLEIEVPRAGNGCKNSILRYSYQEHFLCFIGSLHMCKWYFLLYDL
jgi:hypothetical protein